LMTFCFRRDISSCLACSTAWRCAAVNSLACWRTWKNWMFKHLHRWQL
jgi:hypothetical protein